MVLPALQSQLTAVVQYDSRPVVFQTVAMGVNALAHTREVIASVSERTTEAILFYSGGKDSQVLLDLMAPEFKKVYLVFMYFVKGLDHCDKYMRYAESKYKNVEVIQVPHWILTYLHKDGRYCMPEPKVKLKKLKNVAAEVCDSLGVEWTFYGMRQADSMHRRLMLKTYDKEAICHASKKVYPLTLWKKADVKAYMRLHNLPDSISYGAKTNSSGVTFDPVVFDWLRSHYPNDLLKIYESYPLSRQILFEYDYGKESSKEETD